MGIVQPTSGGAPAGAISPSEPRRERSSSVLQLDGFGEGGGGSEGGSPEAKSVRARGLWKSLLNVVRRHKSVRATFHTQLLDARSFAAELGQAPPPVEVGEVKDRAAEEEDPEFDEDPELVVSEEEDEEVDEILSTRHRGMSAKGGGGGGSVHAQRAQSPYGGMMMPSPDGDGYSEYQHGFVEPLPTLPLMAHHSYSPTGSDAGDEAPPMSPTPDASGHQQTVFMPAP